MFELKTFYANLTQNQKLNMLQLFYDMYYNTNQEVAIYGDEYYYLTAEILLGRLPIKLQYLADTFIEIIIEKYPEFKPYYKPFLEEGETY